MMNVKNSRGLGQTANSEAKGETWKLKLHTTSTSAPADPVRPSRSTARFTHGCTQSRGMSICSMQCGQGCPCPCMQSRVGESILVGCGRTMWPGMEGVICSCLLTSVGWTGCVSQPPDSVPPQEVTRSAMLVWPVVASTLDRGGGPTSANVSSCAPCVSVRAHDSCPAFSGAPCPAPRRPVCLPTTF